NVDSDRIGYLGGGTFTIVVPGSNVSAENLAAMLQSAVFGEAFEIEGRRIHVSCRSGMARHPLDGDRPDALVQHAEAALKRAKETGEQYLHYELQMHGEVAERL